MSVIPRRRSRTAPRRSAGCRRVISAAIWSRSMPHSIGHRGRRKDVQQVAATEQGRLDRPFSRPASRCRRSCRECRDRECCARGPLHRRPHRTSAPCLGIRLPAPSRVDRRRCTPARCRRPAPSRISALASAMASADAKNPRCASPTLVHTRTSGVAISTSLLISPA